MTQRAYRDLSPHQIVSRLADTGVYLASESTIYRGLRAADSLTRRGRAKAPVVRPVPAQIANGPNQVRSWEITYLPTTVRGRLLNLYLILHVWSRKIVAAHVHDTECAAYAATLFERTCRQAAHAWVTAFAEWYNHAHLHSAIRLVTPADRHTGRDTRSSRPGSASTRPRGPNTLHAGAARHATGRWSPPCGRIRPKTRC